MKNVSCDLFIYFLCLFGENAVEAGWFLNLEDMMNGLASCCLSRPLHQRTDTAVVAATSCFGVCLTSHMFTGHLRSPHPFCVLGNHVPEATSRTRNTLSSTVSSTYSRIRLALLSLCLFRYALPLAALVVDAALLVGSMIYLFIFVPVRRKCG